MPKSKRWVVLYCPDDDSHALVTEEAVIYEDQLVVGDDVKFAYPGLKELVTGNVKGLSRKFL